MKKIFSLVVSVVLILGASAASMAAHRGINARQHREQHRINRGIRSGELTGLEARRLEAGLLRINRYESRARSDGHLSPRERARLQHRLDRESRAIYRQTHDRQDRNP
jgi:hypothetical protein